MSDFKHTVVSILKSYNFVDSEFDNVFSAMSEILDARVELMPEYATKTIDRYKTVARDIYDFETFISEAE